MNQNETGVEDTANRRADVYRRSHLKESLVEMTESLAAERRLNDAWCISRLAEPDSIQGDIQFYFLQL
jgi:hypothetical protein